MHENQPPPSWRGLLQRLIRQPAERRRVARELGVRPFTLTRWVNGTHRPRAHNLARLPEVFPALREQFLELISTESASHVPLPARYTDEPGELGIPADCIVQVLAGYATMSGPFQVWTIRNSILQRALEQLDPGQAGLEVSVVQCVPPAHGQSVRMLYACTHTTTLRDNRGGRRLLLLGAESLAGVAIRQFSPALAQTVEQQSAVAWPIMRAGRIAGCLLVSSPHQDFFTEARLVCIEIYANLLALAFSDTEFYASIALQNVPALAHEQAARTSLRERVARLRREQQFLISEAAAEKLALQQMEAEILAHEA